MEKGNYETYEYLPTNGSDNEQFFVVQDNGTIMINRQVVQYTTQVTDDKEALETVQVFNVTPQQFLVDVENSSELMSAPNQFIIPEMETNLYTNSYLLQPETSAPSEPMDQDPSQDVASDKQTETLTDLGIDAQTNKQASSSTEIILTDEQYQMLEQKGWILLEVGDKTYVLDTLGLHDITTNHKLIQKLKNDKQCSNKQESGNGSIMNTGSFDSNATQVNQNIALQDSIQCIIENNIVVDQSVEAVPFTVGNEEVENPNVITKSVNQTEVKDYEQEEDNQTKVFVIENKDIRRVGNTLKVKTKLSLKDFPDKLLLGKMVNGKNLVAKVVKPFTNDNGMIKTEQKQPEESSDAVEDNIPVLLLHNKNILDESEFHLLMQHLFQNNITKCNADDVVTADSVISQLLQIPSFKSSVLDNNLVITKTVQNEDTSGKAINKGLTALVTGRMSLIGDQWKFIHLPHMLQDMVNNTVEFFSKNKKDDADEKRGFDVLHVQISEAKQSATDVVRVSVTVNMRNIPLTLTNKPKPQSSTMYACSFCAAVFNTELELKDHQMINCSKNETKLTIDMEWQPHDYCIINTGNSKSYACMQCNAKFNKLTTCKNHLKTHYSRRTEDSDEKRQTRNNSGNEIYKCNMCSSTYFHPSTLSKHILASHIKIKGKN